MSAAASNSQPSTISAASRILISSALDRDESGVEERIDQGMALVQSITQNVSEKDAIEKLVQHVCRSPQAHDEVSFGILALILLEPQMASRYYRDLTHVSRDGLQSFISNPLQIIIERYAKLSDVARSQLIWLCRELIKNSVLASDSVILTLLRHIQGGDLSPKNMWLCDMVLDMLCEHSLWLEKFPVLLAASVYTYLRLIVDHFSPAYISLRQREVEFCAKTLREKFQECSMIGRDLVRALQCVSRIPEFESIWRTLIERPTALSPALTGGIAQLLAMRTPRRFLACRVTPEMERKLYFMTHSVRLGHQRRYQDWFLKQYLSTPEAQSLRCDLIRFICCIIHPSNDILCSEILPRWAVIGWLLSTCPSNVEAANCKLALFFDWLAFDAEKDNIMYIEPAILVMFHSSLRPAHAHITATLWDFLIRIMREFHRPLEERIRQGIHTSLRCILEKRVLGSLAPMFDHPRLDNDLKVMVREHFGEFCTPEPRRPIIVDDGQVVGVPQAAPIHPLIVDGTPVIVNRDKVADAAKFSDEEDESNGVFRPIKPDLKLEPSIAKMKQEVRLAATATKLNEDGKTKVPPLPHPPPAAHPHPPPSNPVNFLIANNDKSPSPPALDEFLDSLPDPFKIHMTQLQKEKDTESQCNIIETLLQDTVECEVFDRPLAKKLGGCLSHILNEEFHRNVLPDDINKDSLEDAIGTPLFVLLRNFCETSTTQSQSRQTQLQILVEISQYQPKLSLLLLFYQRVMRVYLNRELDQDAYRELAIARNSKLNLEEALKDDLAICEQTNNSRLLCFLVPEVYSQYTSAVLGHSKLLHLVLSIIDPTQLKQLSCQCLQGDLTMLNQDNFLPLAKASLHWETFEQIAFWSLLQAHRFQVEWLYPLVPLLNFVNHQEACNHVMLILAAQKPNPELIQVLFTRELQPQDMFVVTLLKHWTILYADELSVILATLVFPIKGGNKRKRQTKSQVQQCTQQAFLHMDELRKLCKDNTDFFSSEPLHSSLQHAKVAASESQRSKFMDLFALAANDSDEEVPPAKEKTKARSSNRGKRGAGGSGSNTTGGSSSSSSPQKKTVSGSTKKEKSEDGSDTEYDSSTEEETSKPRPPRKKRKQLVSDSD